MDTVSKVFGIKAPKVSKGIQPPVECVNPDLICGVELEIENFTATQNMFLHGRQSLPESIWTIEKDGSLRPNDTSYELITKPMPMQNCLAEMAEIFKNYAFTRQRNYSDRTSVHVHTNVTDWTQDQLCNLSLVYPIVEDILFDFINTFNKPDEIESYYRDTNLYCIPWNQCRMMDQLVLKIFVNGRATLRNWQKYTALNLVPITTYGSVEWRHMHGTNDMEKLTKWFNIIGSIMKFCKETEYADIEKLVMTLNDTSAYQQFYTMIFKEVLPYQEKYRPMMTEGVVNAKIALINRDQRATAKKVQEDFDGYEEAPEDMEEQIILEDRVEPPRPIPPREFFRGPAAGAGQVQVDPFNPNWNQFFAQPAVVANPVAGAAGAVPPHRRRAAAAEQRRQEPPRPVPAEAAAQRADGNLIAQIERMRMEERVQREQERIARDLEAARRRINNGGF